MAEGSSSFWKITLGVGCGILLAMVIGFGMCTAFVGKVAVDTSKQLEKQKADKREALTALSIRDLEGEREGNWIKVRGRVYNGGSADVSFVKVEAEFTDRSGNVIDKDWTYAVGSEKLSPGQSKSFEIMQKGSSKAKSYRVHVVVE